MSFAWPWLFIALPLPWLLRAVCAPAPAGTALRFPRLPEMPQPEPRRSVVMSMAMIAWLLLLAAAARPQLPGPPQLQANSAHSMMLAFDVSMSMATTDLQHGARTVERLEAARLVADRFLEQRASDRVGLVVFGAQAYLHTPLTFDLHAVRAALDSVQTGLAGRETALGDAIALSVKYLKSLPEHQRVLVMLTDGANTAGVMTPERAAWLAQRNGVTIHAAGIGASSDLDETMLKDITAQTGGSYMRATDGAALAAFFASLAHSGPANADQPVMRELYAWPLAAACLLAVTVGWARRRGYA